MIKSENKFLLLIILILSPNYVNSQTSKKLGFGFNLYLLETNIQQNILSKTEDIKSDEFTFGIEGFIHKRIKNNIRIELGIDYSFFQFTTKKKQEIFYGDRNVNNEFNLLFNDSNPIAEFTTSANIFWNDSFCFEGESSDFDKIEVARTYHIRFQSLGMPIRFDYLLGKKSVKIYLNGGVSPEIYLSKNLDFGPKGLGPTTVSVNTRRCASTEIGVGYINRFILTSHNLRIEKYNIRDISISTELGIGIAHQLKKSIFRVGVHYGGNTINFSKARETNFIRETIKLKFGLGYY